MTGCFMTLEGTEGAGKSTAMAFIQSYLTQVGKTVVITREPGGTALAEEIRNVLLHPKSAETMCSQTELLLMFAARAQHIQTCIIPALSAGKWVVSDRFVDASYAYQGGGRGMSMEQIEIMDKLVVSQCYPQLTLLLDLPVEVGFARAEKRSHQKDRIEEEHRDFFTRVRKVYLKRAEQYPDRIKVINANASLSEVNAQLERVLHQFCERNA
ncbi:MAG TPA: dTMP kinase [Gammaproteobacteria bacterium]|jgi:dTMP kinase|nr:dTMP kinase [Gammaproteobacteria bacterium]